MKALKRRAAQVAKRNGKLAYDACDAVDYLRDHPTPSVFERVQNELRGGLLYIEEELRWHQRRKARRRTRFAGCDRSNEGIRTLTIAHSRELRALEEALSAQRRLLKQIGDAFAWVALGYNARSIVPYFSERRTHHLPSGIGLVGQASIAIKAHATGKYIVLENDLTRCLGMGDITVVGLNRPTLPLSIELKSSGALIIGGPLDVQASLAVLQTPEHEQLFEEFSSDTGLATNDSREPIGHPDKQTAEIAERLAIAATLSRGSTRVNPGAHDHWAEMEATLADALRHGYGVHTPSNDIAFLGVDLNAPDAQQSAIAGFEELRVRGFAPKDRKYSALSIKSMHREVTMSWAAPPIALWPVSLEIRAGLLAEQISLVVVTSPDLWQRAFADEGVTLSQGESAWHVTSDSGNTATLDYVEMCALKAGVAFGGLSPRAVAAAVYQELLK